MIRRGIVLAIACCLCVACDFAQPIRSAVEPLVASHSTKQEVVAKLGAGYIWYGSRDSREFAALRESLSYEPLDQFKPVRAAMAQGCHVMYYMAAWQQTWLFFDDSDRLIGYWSALSDHENDPASETEIGGQPESSSG